MMLYDWYENDVNLEHAPTIEDMDMGIGYMNRCIQDLICNLQIAIEKKCCLKKGTTVAEIDEWFNRDAVQKKRLYDIIRKYVVLGTSFDKEEEKLDRLRKERNYFIHTFCFEYQNHGDSILKNNFNRLRNDINSIRKAENSLINCIEKSQRMINVQENLQQQKEIKIAADKKKEEKRNQTKNLVDMKKSVSQVFKSNGYKKNDVIDLRDVGNMLRDAGISYHGKLIDFLDNMGFIIDSYEDGSWGVVV